MAVYFNRPATVFDSAPFNASLLNLATVDAQRFLTTQQHYSQDEQYLAYLDYLRTSSDYPRFPARRNLIKDIATGGEAISKLLLPLPLPEFDRIRSIPTDFRDPGAQWYGRDVLELVNLHSQTLLTALVLSREFEREARKLPSFESSRLCSRVRAAVYGPRE